MTEDLRDGDLLEEERETYALTREDFLGLLDQSGSKRGRTAIRNRALLHLLWVTGVRVSEALSMLNADLELAEPTKDGSSVRVWRAKKAPKGRPKDPGKLKAWAKEREKANRARVERLEGAAANGNEDAKRTVARLRLSEAARGKETWDLVDRGALSAPIELAGLDGKKAEDALRAWRRERAKMPGGRTPSAPLFPAIRQAPAALGQDGSAKVGLSAVSTNAFRVWVAKVGEKAGVGDKVRRLEGTSTRRGMKGLHPHSIRHGAAVREYLACGGQLELVRAFLGHSSQLTTETYLKGLGAMKRSAADEAWDEAKEVTTATLHQALLEILETISEPEAKHAIKHLQGPGREAILAAGKAARRRR